MMTTLYSEVSHGIWNIYNCRTRLACR